MLTKVVVAVMLMAITAAAQSETKWASHGYTEHPKGMVRMDPEAPTASTQGVPIWGDSMASIEVTTGSVDILTEGEKALHQALADREADRFQDLLTKVKALIKERSDLATKLAVVDADIRKLTGYTCTGNDDIRCEKPLSSGWDIQLTPMVIQ